MHDIHRRIDENNALLHLTVCSYTTDMYSKLFDKTEMHEEKATRIPRCSQIYMFTNSNHKKQILAGYVFYTYQISLFRFVIFEIPAV